MKYSNLNEGFKELVRVIEAYCHQQRGVVDDALLREFKSVVDAVLPGLAKYFDNQVPDEIYAKNVIEFAVSGLGSAVMTLIWKECLWAGGKISDITHQSGYSGKALWGRMRSFAKVIAVELWEKEKELYANQSSESFPTLVNHKRRGVLKEVYGLSIREIEVVMLLCQVNEISWKGVAKHFVLSSETVRSHKHAINRKMGIKAGAGVDSKCEIVTRVRELWLQHGLDSQGG